MFGSEYTIGYRFILIMILAFLGSLFGILYDEKRRNMWSAFVFLFAALGLMGAGIVHAMKSQDKQEPGILFSTSSSQK